MLSDLFYDDDEDNNQSSEGRHVSQGSQIRKPPPCRGNCQFVGLENQGATCYLNSLIQAMYMTPELRQGLFRIDPVDLGYTQTLEDGPETAEKEGPNEQIVEQLMAMGFTHPRAYRSVANSGSAGFDQALEYALEHASDGLLDAPLEVKEDESGGKKKRRKPRLIPLELQHLFTKMQLLDCATLSTEDLTTKGFQWQGMDGRVQHDVHELNRLLIDALEKSLKSTPMGGDRLCQQLYQGTLANQTCCLSCEGVTEREEHYYDLLLQVTGCTDMAQSLRAYTAPELLQGSNQYACDSCGCKRDAHRRVAIKSVPPLLSVSCQRFDIDRSTWQRVKVTTMNEFPVAMDMSAFMDGSEGVADPVSTVEEEREKCRGLRSTMTWLHDLHRAATDQAQRLLDRYGTNVDLGKIMEDKDERHQLASAMMPRGNGGGKSDMQYNLFAVIMHHGSAYSGHYSAYIRDCSREGKWSAPTTSRQTYNGGSSSKTEGVKNQVDERVCYIQTRPGQLLVREDSPLNVLLSIIHTHGECGTTSRRNPIPVNAPTMQISVLGGCIKRNLGKNWNQVYQGTHGTLVEFIKKHSIFFTLSSNNTTVSLKDVRYAASGRNDFEAAVCKACVNTSTAVDEVIHENESSSELSDAMLAQQLQDQDNESARSLPVSTEENETPGLEWQTKKKKSRKQRSKDAAKAAAKASRSPTTSGSQSTVGSSCDIVDVSEGGSSSVCRNGESSRKAEEKQSKDEKKAENAVEALAQLILNEFHGPFFCFNDSEVRPVFITDIASAFEGRSSAYLLIYRRTDISLDSNEVPIQVAPPMIWKEKVEAANQILRKQRVDFDKMMKSVRIKVFFPYHLTSIWPCVKVRHFSDLNGVVPETIVKGLDIECDVGWSIRHLCSKIHEILENEHGTQVFGMLGLDSGDVALSVMRPSTSVSSENIEGSRYSISPVLSMCSAAGDVLSHPCTALLWCDKSLPDGSGCLELLSVAPKDLRVTFESGELQGLESIDTSAPCDTTITELCRHASRITGWSLPQVQIHLMQQRQVLHNTKHHGGKQKEYYATPLWKANKPSRSVEAGITYGILDGDEVIVEFVGKSKPGMGGTANREVIRRNRLRTIRVDLDYNGSITQLHKEYNLEVEQRLGDASVDGTNDSLETVENKSDSLLKNIVKVDIDFGASIMQLKLLALEKFGLNKMLADKSRLRSGHNKGDGLLTNESQSLQEASLRDGCSVALELVPLPVDDKVVLRFCEVVGNDRSTKHNPQIPGVRSDEMSAEVSTSSTLRDMREHMLGLIDVRRAEDETRMRLTNWAGECGELVEETMGNTGEDITVSQALEEGVFKSGDLILIEEGKVPAKGMMHVTLFLWRTDMTLPARAETLIDSIPDDTISKFGEIRKMEDIHPARREKLAMLEPLGVVDCHEDSTMNSLYESVLQLVNELRSSEDCAVRMELPESTDRLLLRELRDDLLPGVAYFTVPPKSASVTDLSTIGVGGKKGSAKKASQGTGPPGEKSLRKSGLRSDENGEIRLVVQCLDRSQDSIGAPSTGEFSIWVSTISPTYDGNGNQTSIDFPSWPPSEVMFSGYGSTPSLASLKRHMSSLYQIPFEEIVIFKYLHHNWNWLALKPGMKSLTKRGKKATGNGKMENILVAPYSFRYGDLIGVCDLRACQGKEVDDLVVDREEDIYCRWMKNEKDKEKRVMKANNLKGGKKKQIVEISLRFGGDLDFSDDDVSDS